MGTAAKNIARRVKLHQVSVVPAGTKPVNDPGRLKNGAYRLREWQKRAVEQLGVKPLAMIVAPMGSGKSTLLRAFGCLFLRSGCKVIVSVPQTPIAWSFKCIKLEMPDGSVATWSPEHFLINEVDCVQRIVDFVLGRKSAHEAGRVLVCTHAALVRAHQILMDGWNGRGTPWKGCALLLDEVHHSLAHGNSEDEELNRLGNLVTHWVSKAAGPLRLATATPMRADDMRILPESARKKFERFVYPMDEYLAQMKHLREIRIKYLIGDPHDAIKHLFGESRARSLVHLPPVNSGLVRGAGRDKFGVLAGYEASVGRSVKSTYEHYRAYRCHGEVITGVDLVDPADRDARKDHLLRCISDGSGLPDIIWALNMGREGLDDPSLARGIVIGARTSLPMILQMLGRVIRDFPGKRVVEFVMVLPFEGREDPQQLQNYLKLMLASMVFEWQFAPITVRCTPRGRKAIERLREDTEAFAGAVESVVENAVLRDGSGETSEEVVAAALKGRGWDDEEGDAVVRHIVSLFSEKSMRVMHRVEDIGWDPAVATNTFGCLREYALSFDFETLATLRRSLGKEIPFSIPYAKKKMREYRDARLRDAGVTA